MLANMLVATSLPVKVLDVVIAWGGAIVAIILVIFLVKDAIRYKNGQISVGKVLMESLILIVIIGIIFAAGGFDTFGRIFENVTKEVITEEHLPNLGD